MPRAKSTAPIRLTLVSYQVGLGECFLLSFQYALEVRHVLVDFGSGRVPPDTRRRSQIATDIRRRTAGKLDAIVEMQPRVDRVSGAATNPRNGSHDMVALLKPAFVARPWRANPNVRPDARRTFETTTATGRHADSGLETVLPGVIVRVLRPPSLARSKAITNGRSEDASRSRQIHTPAGRIFAAVRASALPTARSVSGARVPEFARWFRQRLQRVSEELLESARALEDRNDTSAALLFEIGRNCFRLSGDAKIEDLELASGKSKEALSKGVRLHHIGHDGHKSARATRRAVVRAREKERSFLTTLDHQGAVLSKVIDFAL